MRYISLSIVFIFLLIGSIEGRSQGIEAEKQVGHREDDSTDLVIEGTNGFVIRFDDTKLKNPRTLTIEEMPARILRLRFDSGVTVEGERFVINYINKKTKICTDKIELFDNNEDNIPVQMVIKRCDQATNQTRSTTCVAKKLRVALWSMEVTTYKE